MDDDHVEKVLSVIRQNRRLTVREVAEEVGICKSSCHLILTGKRKMRRHQVASKAINLKKKFGFFMDCPRLWN